MLTQNLIADDENHNNPFDDNREVNDILESQKLLSFNSKPKSNQAD